MTYAFDTLAYARRLRDGGIAVEVAEVHADAAREFIMTELCTRSDLEGVRRELEASFSNRFDRLETSLATNVQRLETSLATQVERLEAADRSLRDDMKEGFLSVRRDMAAAMTSLEDRMTVRMGFMLATAIAALAAIIKL